MSKPTGRRERDERPSPAVSPKVHVARLDRNHLVVTSPTDLTDGDRQAIIDTLGDRGHPTIAQDRAWLKPAEAELTLGGYPRLPRGEGS